MAIGDDCSVIRPSDLSHALLTADISIEGVHFTREFCGAFDIGWKAMIANISDIAAMGGDSRYALVSLGIPHDAEEEYVLEMYRGIIDAASSARAKIVGGDISRSKSFVISIALYGEVKKGRAIYRSGAHEGEHLYVTGRLGGSLAGLELLQSGTVDEKYNAFYARHRRPTSRHDIVHDIIAQFAPTAMIDISDGLISDVKHLCEESGVGVCIYGDRIPLFEGLEEYAKAKGKDPLVYALSSGEEYELLFTSKKWLADTIHLYIDDVPVRLIGEIRKQRLSIVENGIEKDLQGYGYDHFAQ